MAQVRRQTGESWLNSLSQAIYTATYTYDAAGELTAASDNNSSYTYSYNADGQVTGATVTYPGLSSSALTTLTYTYDPMGHLSSLTDSLGGSVSYGFSPINQLMVMSMAVGTSNIQVSCTYDSQERLSSVNWTSNATGNQSLTGSYSYDNANRLTTLSYYVGTSQTALMSFSYGYNSASEVTSYTGPDGSLTYSYDKNGQLTGVSGAQNLSYSFDANGNRTMTGYSTGTGNELTSDGVYNYTYDQAGDVLTQTNISSGDVTGYTYDYEGRLTGLTVKDSHGTLLQQETFTYDVQGRQIGADVNGTQRWTVYDGQNPYMDVNGSGSVTERYLSNPNALDELFARMGASGTADWYATDNLDSVRAVVDTSGSVIDQLVYDAFGGLVSETNASNGDRFKYAGGEQDSITGDYRFGARYYSTLDGRFVSQDPSGLGPDSNPYRYTYNEPTDLTDPAGMMPSTATVSADFATSIFRQYLPADKVSQAQQLWTGGMDVMGAVGILAPPKLSWWEKLNLMSGATNFFAGWADGLTGGMTKKLRQNLGQDIYVDTNSGAYVWGGRTAFTHNVVMGGLGLRQLATSGSRLIGGGGLQLAFAGGRAAGPTLALAGDGALAIEGGIALTTALGNVYMTGVPSGTGGVDPQSLNIEGSTQPELFDGRIQAMRQQLRIDPDAFWKQALSQDGPIEIWEINGQRFLYNGNHRWFAAVEEGVTIPADNIRIIDKTGSQIPTWLLNQMQRLPGMR